MTTTTTTTTSQSVIDTVNLFLKEESNCTVYINMYTKNTDIHARAHTVVPIQSPANIDENTIMGHFVKVDNVFLVFIIIFFHVWN